MPAPFPTGVETAAAAEAAWLKRTSLKGHALDRTGAAAKTAAGPPNLAAEVSVAPDLAAEVSEAPDLAAEVLEITGLSVARASMNV